MKEVIQELKGEPPFQQAKFVRVGRRVIVGPANEVYHKELAERLGVPGDSADDHGLLIFNLRNKIILISGNSGSFDLASAEARAETGRCVCGIVGDHLHVVANHPIKGEVFDSKKK